MKNFRRSLQYLWPYRVRIGVAIACVICIACMWGGSLALVLPAAKILISEEGLHGWAYMSVVSDRLGRQIVRQNAPTDTVIEDSNGERVEIATVLNVVKITDSIAAKTNDANALSPSDWIVGLQEGNSPPVRMEVEPLLQKLSDYQQGRQVGLWVLRRGSPRPVTIAATMGQPSWSSLLLWRVSRLFPDPGNDYMKRFPLFIALLVVVIVISLVRGFFTFVQEYLIGTAIWRGIMDMRCDIYNAVLHLPTTFFSEKGVTDATSRFVQDTNELARAENTLLGKTLVEPAKAAASLAVALWFSWKLTLLTVIAGPPAYYFIHRFGKKMHRASRRALEELSQMLGVLDETLQGIRIVKSYTMEGAERRRFFRVNRKLVRQQNKMERLDALTGPTTETLGMIAASLAAGLAGYLVFHKGVYSDQEKSMAWMGGNLDQERFMAWMGTLFALFDPMRKLAKVSLRFQAGDAAGARIFELQDMPREKFVPMAPALPRHAKSIEFRNVSFRYPSASSDALKDIQLNIRAGETIAVVGPNGCGKTTLVTLLPRLIDPTSGTVFIDGQDISRCSVRSLRRQIGLVTQDAVIFHASIGENISYGLRRPKAGEVLAAAKKAFVDEFVHDLPQGYDTMVGEYGATLSGGQKQRIAIARAILRDPAILIFDEAMSQVDADSESRIHQVMLEFSKGRTTLMIAHRFATVLSATQIVVMNDGRILDSGTHEQLLTRCELYTHLYQTQFSDSGGNHP